jgi:hypothetical protein
MLKAGKAVDKPKEHAQLTSLLSPSVFFVFYAPCRRTSRVAFGIEVTKSRGSECMRANSASAQTMFMFSSKASCDRDRRTGSMMARKRARCLTFSPIGVAVPSLLLAALGAALASSLLSPLSSSQGSFDATRRCKKRQTSSRVPFRVHSVIILPWTANGRGKKKKVAEYQLEKTRI